MSTGATNIERNPITINPAYIGATLRGHLIKKNRQTADAQSDVKTVSPMVAELTAAEINESFAGLVAAMVELGCNTSNHITIPVVPATKEVMDKFLDSVTDEVLKSMRTSDNRLLDRTDNTVRCTLEQIKAAYGGVKEVISALKEYFAENPTLSPDDCVQMVSQLNSSGISGRFNVAYLLEGNEMKSVDGIRAGHYDSVRIPVTLLSARCNERMRLKKSLDTLLNTYLIKNGLVAKSRELYAAIPAGKLQGSKDRNTQEYKDYVAFRNECLEKIADEKRDPSILDMNSEYAGLSWLSPEKFAKLELPTTAFGDLSENECSELTRFMFQSKWFLPIWQDQNKVDIYLMVASNELRKQQANPELREAERNKWLNETREKDYVDKGHREFDGIDMEHLDKLSVEARNRIMEIISMNEKELFEFIIMRTVEILVRNYTETEQGTLDVDDQIAAGTSYRNIQEAREAFDGLLNSAKWADAKEIGDKPWAKGHTSGMEYAKKVFGEDDSFVTKELTAASIFFRISNIFEQINDGQMEIDIASELGYKDSEVYKSFIAWTKDRELKEEENQAKLGALEASLQNHEINYLVGDFTVLYPSYSMKSAKIWDEDGLEYPSVMAMVNSRRALTKKDRKDILDQVAAVKERHHITDWDANSEIIDRFKDRYKNDEISKSQFNAEFSRTAIVAVVRRCLVDDAFRKTLTVVGKLGLKFVDDAFDTIDKSGLVDIYRAVSILLAKGMIPTWDQCVSVFGQKEAETK